MNTKIEIAEQDLFVLMGQKDCEIFIKDKKIESLEKAIIDIESIKRKNIELTESNKKISEKNIELDRALTDARLELTQTIAEIEGLNVKHSKSKKRDEGNAPNA